MLKCHFQKIALPITFPAKRRPGFSVFHTSRLCLSLPKVTIFPAFTKGPGLRLSQCCRLLVSCPKDWSCCLAINRLWAFVAGSDLQAFIKANVPHPLQQWAAETGGLNSERGSESKGQWHEAWRRTVGFILVRIQAWQLPKHAQPPFNRQCLKPRTARKKQTKINQGVWHRGQAGGRNQVRVCHRIVIKTGRTAAPSSKLDRRHGITQESQHEAREIYRPIAYNGPHITRVGFSDAMVTGHSPNNITKSKLLPTSLLNSDQKMPIIMLLGWKSHVCSA